MEGVHCKLGEVVTWQFGVPPMRGDPDSVMKMADLSADDAMAVARVNVTVAVVCVFLAWEPRAITGAAVIILVDMAGNAPVLEASSKLVPSLVVAAWTAVKAFWATAGVVNWEKDKRISVVGTLPVPLLVNIKILMT